MTCRRRREVGDNQLRNIRTDVIRHLYAQEWIPLLDLPHSVDRIYGGDIMELCIWRSGLNQVKNFLDRFNDRIKYYIKGNGRVFNRISYN